MPQQETTPTEGFATPVNQMPPPINTAREITSSPETAVYESKLVMSLTPTSTDDILSQLDEAIDNINHVHHIPKPQPPKPSTPQPQKSVTPQPQKRVRPESVESVLFVNDFGMNDLMVLIRGAAQSEKIKSKITHGRHTSYNIRNEISEVFKDSQARLDQLEKVMIKKDVSLF
jgi:hypothetical protein